MHHAVYICIATIVRNFVDVYLFIDFIGQEEGCGFKYYI